MADEKNGVNGHIAPTPKILADFFKQVEKGFIEETVEVQGFKFLLRTPNEDAEAWSDNFIRPSSPMSFLSARRVPRLSVSIKSINGESVDTMFSYPDDLPKTERDQLDKSAELKRYWVWQQLMAQLAQMPPPVIDELYKSYSKLIERRDAALAGVVGADPNASSRTPGGASAAMS